MIVKCDDCGASFEDVYRSTICPHKAFPANDGDNNFVVHNEAYLSTNQYDANYFLRGKQSGKSLYENYRWMPELTVPMVEAIIKHLGIDRDDVVLDFGCARGYVVRAFRELGYVAYGYDTSEWAVENCDPNTYHYLTRRQEIAFPRDEPIYDWVIAKDVLEHVEGVDLAIRDMMRHTRKGVFVVVPLSEVDGERYVVRCYEKDVTHIHRLTLATWVSLFVRPGWSVEAAYRVPGVKDNYSRFEMGNGFIVTRRLKCDTQASA